MTGPDHYREGERLLAGRPVSDEEISRGIAPGVWPPSRMDLLAAHAHFTAALVACLAAHQHPESTSWAKVIEP
ncbi:hypothetical protein [Streptomyces ipomoeae]|uniref:hypothetical protein n=1 Tax=Streptomyces ipomoeae TaxID=103232 RepID=UPI0029BAD803|nr:hypothetical protein [Streptomyces ipomoeae]MDX2697011.1 hypothetical protein [Streptomyces ipomoeae]